MLSRREVQYRTTVHPPNTRHLRRPPGHQLRTRFPKALHNHNVNPLQSTHEDKEFVHIAMELCAGGELFDSIVEAGNFTEKKAALYFRKMVEVVNHCHELGVMHRDLKPGACGAAAWRSARR